MTPRWEMTYLGRDVFIAECTTCTWSHTGTVAQAQNAAIKHVRGVHL